MKKSERAPKYPFTHHLDLHIISCFARRKLKLPSLLSLKMTFSYISYWYRKQHSLCCICMIQVRILDSYIVLKDKAGNGENLRIKCLRKNCLELNFKFDLLTVRH